MRYLKVFTDFATSMDPLSDAEKGRLFMAMLKYAESGAAPDLRGGERFLWAVAKQMIDRELESYEAVRERNRNNATSRYQSQRGATSRSDTHQDKDKDKDTKEKLPIGSKEKAAAFSAPTVDEVAAYGRTIGHPECADAFVDHYKSNGWLVSGRSKMDDWQASYRNWVRNEDTYSRPKKRMGANAGYKQTPLSDKDFESMFVNLDQPLEEEKYVQ